MPEQALVDRQPDPGVCDLTSVGPAAQLPDDVAHLRDGLRGHGLAETCEAARGVHGDTAADRGVAVADQPFGLALLAEPDVLVPVELEGLGEVVDLGEIEILRADSGLFVRSSCDGVPEPQL